MNGFVCQALSKYTTLTIGGYNIFNAYSNRYGPIGEGRFQPDNRYFGDKSFAEEAYDNGPPENIGESFGIPPPRITVSLTTRL